MYTYQGSVPFIKTSNGAFPVARVLLVMLCPLHEIELEYTVFDVLIN